jgi:hypothetical protein
MKNLIWSFWIFALVFVTSCGPRYSALTNNLVTDFDLNDATLKKVQFYVSEDIILRRGVTTGKADIKGGVLRTHKGRKVEEICIKRGTPGVFLYRKEDNQLAISFESSKGTDDRYLLFGLNKTYDNRYVLLASDWKSGIGYIQYDGRQYEVEASKAFLMVDLRREQETEAKRRKANGRRID